MPNLHLTTNLNQVNSSYTSLSNDWRNMSELPTMLLSIQFKRKESRQCSCKIHHSNNIYQKAMAQQHHARKCELYIMKKLELTFMLRNFQACRSEELESAYSSDASAFPCGNNVQAYVCNPLSHYSQFHIDQGFLLDRFYQTQVI